MSAGAAIANHAYLLSAAPAHRRFMQALRDPQQAQLRIVQRILRANSGTEIGRRLGFAEIDDVRTFQERVQLSSYDDYGPAIDRLAEGEAGLLTSSPVTFMEPTGGSSGALKLIPYTGPLMAEFSAATMPWVFDLLRHRRRLRMGRAYWAVSPPVTGRGRTSGGIRIGLDDDSDYFPAVARKLLDQTFAIPRSVSAVTKTAAWRYLVMRALLATPDLSLISVWNPSFLTLLAGVLDERFDDLLMDLESGLLSVELTGELRMQLERALPARPRLAQHLRQRFGRKPPADLGELWPQLDLVSCWTDGHAGRAVGSMRRRFPAVEVQGKGLLATEGVVSFPLLGLVHPVAAVTSHFLEFLDEQGRAHPVHEVREGAVYEVALTTGGGLYRYRLRDLVRIEGWIAKTPLLSFVARADGAADLVGEKVTPAFAEQVISRACSDLSVVPTFAMLAPLHGEPPGYVLFVESGRGTPLRDLEARVDQLLSEAHHYRLCRQLGQLRPVRVMAVEGGEQLYEVVCAKRGQRVGAIKPPSLDAQTDRALDFARAAGFAE